MKSVHECTERGRLSLFGRNPLKFCLYFVYHRHKYFEKKNSSFCPYGLRMYRQRSFYSLHHIWPSTRQIQKRKKCMCKTVWLRIRPTGWGERSANEKYTDSVLLLRLFTFFVIIYIFAGSIPDGVVGIFHWHNPSGRTMALGSTQPLTEMSTRNISWR